MRKWKENDISSFSLHFLSISSFSLHFLFISSFSLHFLAARLQGCNRLRNTALNMDDIPILVKGKILASLQVHSVIALSSIVWVTVTIAKKAIKIKNQGSYLKVFCIITCLFSTRLLNYSITKRCSIHTAPQQCQSDRLGTLDFLIDSCYCDQDMTISVAG